MKFIRSLASGRLTVVCLLLLLVLVIWGTIFQSQYGHYQAQKKFFHSWVVLFWGAIPFPGVVLVLWVLFLNLIAALIFKIGFHLRKAGNILTHLGILILLIGGFLSFYYAEESVLTLGEGKSSSVSISNQAWELAVWKSIESNPTVFAIDAHRISKGNWTSFPQLNLKVKLRRFYENCEPVSEGSVKNHSDVRGLKRLPLEGDPDKNVPGMILSIAGSLGQPLTDIFLLGGQLKAKELSGGAFPLKMELRKKRHSLPFNIKLIDFRKVFHPGSQIPKSFESHVEVQNDNFTRPAVISMNRPLRSHHHTIYQSSYFQARDGSEYSIFSVVRNRGRFFPYIASVLMFLGMCVHFLLLLFKKKGGSK